MLMKALNAEKRLPSHLRAARSPHVHGDHQPHSHHHHQQQHHGHFDGGKSFPSLVDSSLSSAQHLSVPAGPLHPDTNGIAGFDDTHSRPPASASLHGSEHASDLDGLGAVALPSPMLGAHSVEREAVVNMALNEPTFNHADTLSVLHLDEVETFIDCLFAQVL